MAYSAKKRRVISSVVVALGLTGTVLIYWLAHNHTNPDSLGLFRVVFAITVVGLAIRSFSYMDEVQRHTAQKRWFWGSWIGLIVTFPVVILLQTHRPWLDAAVQFVFRHPAMPGMYFSLGVILPVVLQAGSALLLKLLDKLPRGSQS